MYRGYQKQESTKTRHQRHLLGNSLGVYKLQMLTCQSQFVYNCLGYVDQNMPLHTFDYAKSQRFVSSIGNIKKAM